LMPGVEQLKRMTRAAEDFGFEREWTDAATFSCLQTRVELNPVLKHAADGPAKIDIIFYDEGRPLFAVQVFPFVVAVSDFEEEKIYFDIVLKARFFEVFDDSEPNNYLLKMHLGTQSKVCFLSRAWKVL